MHCAEINCCRCKLKIPLWCNIQQCTLDFAYIFQPKISIYSQHLWAFVFFCLVPILKSKYIRPNDLKFMKQLFNIAVLKCLIVSTGAIYEYIYFSGYYLDRPQIWSGISYFIVSNVSTLYIGPICTTCSIFKPEPKCDGHFKKVLVMLRSLLHWIRCRWAAWSTGVQTITFVTFNLRETVISLPLLD